MAGGPEAAEIRCCRNALSFGLGTRVRKDYRGNGGLDVVIAQVAGENCAVGPDKKDGRDGIHAVGLNITPTTQRPGELDLMASENTDTSAADQFITLSFERRA